MKTWPTLYKKTSTGAIQFWEIKVTDTIGQITENEYASEVGIITIKYGQLGTDSPQITNDTILKGKNEGKKNETTAYEQAIAEAQAKWEKQKKKSYVESIDAAQAGEIDDIIEGGVTPMLAHKFADHGHKIKYPCYGQPKIDGIRCIAIVENGECTMWSRTRKKITSCPHIIMELEALFQDSDIILDGELYSDKFKDNFEHIVHLVRQEEPDKDYEDVQYHIYDVIPEVELSFYARFETLREWLAFLEEDSSLRLVETELIQKEDDVMKKFEYYRDQGYEGLMLRNKDSKYVNKRSYDLLKVKEFEDGEFEIIGAEEGRGKLQGHVGAFICRTKDGRQFLAKMSGNTERLAEYFRDPSSYLGRQLTVKYQGFTSKEKVPRFPVGLRIREDV